MPGGSRCSVAICDSHSTKAKALQLPIAFFSFPKDPIIREQWVHKCYRKDIVNPDTAKICSRHFLLKDFDDSLKAKLMNIPPKRLKPKAVPSQYLLFEKCHDLPHTIEEHQETIFDNLTNAEPLQTKADEALQYSESPLSSPDESHLEFEEIVKTFPKHDINLAREIEALQTKVKHLNQNLYREMKKAEMLQMKISLLENKIEESNQDTSFEQKVKRRKNI